MMYYNLKPILQKIPCKLINCLTRSIEKDYIYAEFILDHHILKIEFNDEESHPTNVDLNYQSTKINVDKII